MKERLPSDKKIPSRSSKVIRGRQHDDQSSNVVEEYTPAEGGHDQGLVWSNLVDEIQKIYPQPLARDEAESAAKNLVTFYRTLLAIKKRTEQNRLHEQCR